MSTPSPAPVFTKPALPEGLAALLTFVFLAVVRTAWMSDDAMITLRTVLNVTHGFGLRYNIAERVQTFTHPPAQHKYRLTFIGQERVRGTVEVGPVPQYRRAPGLVNYTIDVPPRASDRGFDILLVTPVAGDDKYALGHVLFH